MAAKTAEPNEEVERLKSLEADFTDDELVDAKIDQRLANITSKRWGITLPNVKLKALLAKHARPENCPVITTVRVNLHLPGNLHQTVHQENAFTAQRPTPPDQLHETAQACHQLYCG